MAKQIVNARIYTTELSSVRENNEVIWQLKLLVGTENWNAPIIFDIKSLDEIREIMDIVEVNNWSDMRWRFVRAELDMNEDGSGKLLAIGHIIDERWFREEKEAADTATDATTGAAVEAEEIPADKKD